MPYALESYKALTFHDAVPGFLEGKSSPRAYLERCLETIAEREPEVKGWVVLNEKEAQAAADASTKRYRDARPLSPIDGMPIGIKDLILTKDMPTEMGSPLYRGHFPKQDSASVQALRQAGAIILGKTVTTELGMSHPGPTTNPFDKTRTPGGSSSGSAAVVGAGMVPAAIGTQVVGSIIRPASFCANYALKPTFGSIHRGERQGFSQSHFGVHAGDLTDTWHVAIEMARRAGGDPGHPGLFGADGLHDAVKPSRLIFIETEGWPDVDEETRVAFEKLLKTLQTSGIKILDRQSSSVIEAFEIAIGESLALCRDICAFELRWSLENLLEEHGGGLSDSMMSRLDLARKMSLDDYRDALRKRETMKQLHLEVANLGDAMISLSSIGPAPSLTNSLADGGISHTTGLPSFNAPTSLLGAPTVNLPLLAVADLPVGVQLIGPPHGDYRLMGLSRWVASTVLGR